MLRKLLRLRPPRLRYSGSQSEVLLGRKEGGQLGGAFLDKVSISAELVHVMGTQRLQLMYSTGHGEGA